MNIKEYRKIPKVSGLYQIINLVNNKMYIGSAVNLRRRVHKHYYELTKGVHNNEHLLRAFNKYGESKFKVNIFIMNVSHDVLLSKEKQFIIQCDALTKGYNMILDNSEHFKDLNKSYKHIESNRNIQQKAVLGFNRFTGIKVYHCKSLTEAAKLINDQTTNISQCCNGKLNYVKDIIWIYAKAYDSKTKYTFTEYASKGRKFSKEHKNKIRNKIIQHKGRKVYKYSEVLELVEEYLTITEAEHTNNIKKDMLRYKLDKDKLHLGYFWKTNKL